MFFWVEGAEGRQPNFLGSSIDVIDAHQYSLYRWLDRRGTSGAQDSKGQHDGLVWTDASTCIVKDSCHASSLGELARI